MKALVLRRPGSLSQMKVEEIDDPVVLPGQVLVELSAAGLNPSDYKLGLSGHPGWKYPHVSGLDGVGSVRACGAGVDPAILGKRVVFHADLRMDGCFAQFVCVPSHTIALIPDSVSDFDAACLPCAGLTALQALVERARIEEGQTVLVQGGAGGVGGFAIQLARQFGARVIATCSPENTEYVRTLGAHEVIDYSRDSLEDRVKELSGGMGVDVVIDPNGNKSASAALSLLGYGGHLVCLSGLPELDRYNHSTMAPSIHDIAVGNALAFGSTESQSRLAQGLDTLLAMLLEKKIASTHAKTVPLEEVPGYLELLRERHVRGKIVADLSLMN